MTNARQLDYEALALAALMIAPTYDRMVSEFGAGNARALLKRLGVENPNSHEARLFRRAVWRLRNTP